MRQFCISEKGKTSNNILKYSENSICRTYHHHECRNPGGSPSVIFFSHRISDRNVCAAFCAPTCNRYSYTYSANLFRNNNYNKKEKQVKK